MTTTNELGAYLRARRDLVQPSHVGVTVDSHRRVPGLRRDEVALLAGISSEYYLRLEQGRDRHPSPQVLDALARVLELETEARTYLYQLAQPSLRRSAKRRAERVPEGIKQFVMSRDDIPAMILGRYQDILVANPLANALEGATAGTNLLHAAFLNPDVRAMHPEGWEQITSGLVAGMRALAGPESTDPYLAQLVGELSVRSEEFRRLWARHDVRPRTGGSILIKHPQIGPIRLNYEKLAISGTDGQVLVLHHAAPGSDAAQSLALLAHTQGLRPA